VRSMLNGVLAHPGRAAIALMLGTILAVPPSPVAAHVTRVVGRYTFLIVLIEEPYFQDNRAGFEFWVRDGDRPVDGLDRTLRAEAIGHGAAVSLPISPRNQRGFYDAPFYPGSGRKYSLHLSGSVEGTPIDELFPVTFPAYPRAASIGAASAPASLQPDMAGPATVLVAGAAVALVVLSATALVIARRRRLRTMPPGSGAALDEV
jgi:hypothetical protein